MKKLTKKQLKKYGLKAVKFSKLTNGDEFNMPCDFDSSMLNNFTFYRRKLVDGEIIFADGTPMAKPRTANDFSKNYKMVFVKA